MNLKSKTIITKARKIRLIAMDVDGVLTGGEIIILQNSQDVKVWNVKDRFAFHLISRSGDDIKLAWISGRKSQDVALRAKEIGIHALYQDCMTKREALEKIAIKFNVAMNEIAYLGDDLVDIPVFRCVGLSVCPKDAAPEVKKEVDFITSAPGGRGVFREVAELILKTRGSWKNATRNYV